MSALFAALAERNRRSGGVPRRRTWAGGAWMFEGLLAAGLGIGAVSSVVLLLWTTSPHPAEGPGTALRVALDLWLLGHGTELLRIETRTGVPAPIGLTPLLLAALPAWLLHRAVRVSVLPEDAPDARPGEGLHAAPWICAGYCMAAAVAVVHTMTEGPIRPVPPSAALHIPLFALAVTLLTAWHHSGPPPLRGPLRRPAEALLRLQETGAPRAALAAVCTFVCVGALLAAVALARHHALAEAAFHSLTGDWSGRLAVLFLAAALAPNAAVWAACYGLGPGFALGTGALVAPLAPAPALPGGGSSDRVPAFPLLAAVPAEGLLVTAVAVPLAGALVVAWFVARTAVPVRAARQAATGPLATAVAVLLAALLAGAGMMLLATLAGGPLGTGNLAVFGPDRLPAGLAAFGWITLLGIPAALALRAWRLRRPHLTRTVASGVRSRLRRLVRFRRRPRSAGTADTAETADTAGTAGTARGAETAGRATAGRTPASR
ncbi:DUF6350 family protein [Streptomyces sp. YIM 98790]|uniref:cell division protein PerM n=1 Tax=Streptomyces sp. YIM 98790 TaxID=2689077 RepID=UPI00140B5651|nr:DUF6350 family protein [Streptomyces sp. YIM 98790]